MELPREILDRVDRVIEYHQSGKHADGGGAPRPPDWANQPSPYRIFEDRPKSPLPTTLLDTSTATLSILHTGLDAVAESLHRPPQNLKTLASWLYMAAGLTTKRRNAAGGITWSRSCPSGGDVFPCEIYVAALGIDGLAPGLFHFNPREFSLRQLREGPQTLAALKRGRPDLEFLKNAPGAVLVSTLFCRASWRFGRRGYRHALLDAGHQVQNLVTAATGLGIQNLTRLRMNDGMMRELIGLSPDTEFADAEAIQAMVVWADKAEKPLAAPAVRESPIRHAPMTPIARGRLARDIKSYGSILAVHEDCVAPGMAIREVRPPITELSILSRDFPAEIMPIPDPPDGGESLRRALLSNPTAPDFLPAAISRDQLWNISRVGFRGGSYFPIFPDGPHVGLVRPFWIVQAVTGIESGIWYYRPQTDQWSPLNYGHFRADVSHLAMDDVRFAHASAVCVLLGNIHRVLNIGGPDLYRLAFLEAGVAAQRIVLAAGSLGLGFAITGDFYDEPVRTFLGVDKTGWEPLYMVGIGSPSANAASSATA